MGALGLAHYSEAAAVWLQSLLGDLLAEECHRIEAEGRQASAPIQPEQFFQPEHIQLV